MFVTELPVADYDTLSDWSVSNDPKIGRVSLRQLVNDGISGAVIDNIGL
jgi:hypothetical protein